MNRSQKREARQAARQGVQAPETVAAVEQPPARPKRKVKAPVTAARPRRRGR